jgi:hypothetical protein
MKIVKPAEKWLLIRLFVNIAIKNFVRNINIHSYISVKKVKIRSRFLKTAFSTGKGHIYPTNAIIAKNSFVEITVTHLTTTAKKLKTITIVPISLELQ